MSRKLHFVILVLLLLGSFFVRVYRTPDLLRFYYDQGRDALVVADMIKDHKPVLVGPTTGLAGILRGPAFYYLLLPAYLIGQGSPVTAAIWLQIINTFGLFIFYLVAKHLFSPLAGLIAVFLMGFSAHMVDLSRWLSEPSLILTSVPLTLYSLIQVLRSRTLQVWLPIVALVLGLNLQFEMASEIWFIPVVLILLFLRGRTLQIPRRTLFISVVVFLLTFAPQVIFDLRHQGIMRKAIIENFASQSASSFGFDQKTVESRLKLFFDTYTYIVSPGYSWTLPLTTILLLPIFFFHRLRKQFLLPLIFFTTPLLILTFFTGNSGNFYTYYLLGTFPIFLLLVSGILSVYLSRSSIVFVAPLLILTIYSFSNYRVLGNFLRQGINGPNSITIRNQLDNIDWIYQQAADEPFSVDIYVPPVIPYSYDYLFRWYGQNRYGYTPNPSPQTLEFTLYEVDPDGDRFASWYQGHTADHPSLLNEFSSGGVHTELRSSK